MRLFLLDTSVLIDLSRGLPGVRDRLSDLLVTGSRAGVCSVSVAEFWAGVPPERVPFVAALLDEFAYWDIPRDAAERAGGLRYHLARRGYTLHVADALLAGLALSLRAVLVTDNQKDFVHTGVPLIGLRG